MYLKGNRNKSNKLLSMSCSRLDFRNIEEELLNWPCILAKSLPQLKYVKCLFKWNFFGFRTTFH